MLPSGRSTGGAAPPGMGPRDERAHPSAAVEEWVFAFWRPDGSLGGLSGHRLLGRTAWYWAALARRGAAVLHVGEWDVGVRSDPMIVKAHALWAEHMCDSPFQQWSVGNETYAVALDDPEAALGAAYGIPTPIAFDVEWYATAPASAIPDGYEQIGVVHGVIDVADDGVATRIDVAEAPAWRCHRWSATTLGPVELAPAVAHTGMRAPFAFPDGSVLDAVLLPSGWHARGSFDALRP